MTKPRKKYRQRWTPNPLAYQTAMMGVRMLTTDDVIQMAIKPSMAVDAIARGEPKQDDWRDLFDAFNLLEELIRQGRASDPDGLIAAAQADIVAIFERKSSAVYGAELSTLRDFCGAYAQILKSVTNAEVFEAFESVQRRVNLVLTTKTPQPGVHVMMAA